MHNDGMSEPTTMDHPRPQMVRPGWRDLSGPWQFAFDDRGVGMLDRWQAREDVFDRIIQVPFPFESPASGIGDTGFHSTVWYRLVVTASVPPGRRLLLHFGAVDYRAHVWVNGESVAYHEGGSTPFTADITPALRADGHQEIVVRAQDSPGDLRQPRGKQDWQREPHAIWYDRTSGIWQPVWLEEVPATRIFSLRWSPDVDARSLTLIVRLRVGRPAHGPLRLRVVLRLGGHVLVDDSYLADRGELQRRITLVENDMSLGNSEMLWSPDRPNLIEATIILMDGDVAVDEVQSYTALRSFTATGGRLLLNGRPYFLRLVLAQNFWPQSHLAAPDADQLRKEVQLIKDLGFNGVRLHQKIEDPRFLAWCDRLGVLVWAEMPAAYEFSRQTIGRLTREWLEVLERDASHPCIIAWVPVNESWGVPALERAPEQEHLVRALYHLTKSVDPHRLVIGNDGWEQPVTDVVTVHDYTARGDVLRQRYGSATAMDHTLTHTQPGYRAVFLNGAARDGHPVVISEFGGVSLDLSDSPGWRGYGSVRTPEELLDRLDDLVTALLSSPAVAGFCWTQLTDTQQERNGLTTADRRPKIDAGKIRQITSRLSAAVPGDAVNEFAFGDYTPAAPAE